MLVSRTAYEGLLHRLAVLTSVPGGGAVPATTAEVVPGECVGSDDALPERGPRRGAESRAALADREALLGPLGRPSESVETQFGLVDFETADFLAVEGFGGGSAEGGAGRVEGRGGPGPDEAIARQ